MFIVGTRNISNTINLSWNTIRKLHYEDGLPLVRLGNQWALDLKTFREWLSNRSESKVKQ